MNSGNMKYRIKTFGTRFIVERKGWFLWHTESFEIDIGYGPDAIINCPRVFESIEDATQYIKEQLNQNGFIIKTLTNEVKD